MVVRHQGRWNMKVSSDGRLRVENPTDSGRNPPPGTSASLLVHTPAKLNLFLKVLGQRADGYHELETLMVSIGLFDSLLFSDDDSGRLSLRCHGSATGTERPANQDLPAGADNLIVRAAERLRQRTGCERGTAITLIKRIPMQAGLGGGSSDAAATLVALNRLWGLDLSSAELHSIAAELGSDVNFFLDSPAAAICRGRGERVERIRLPRRLHAVLACPASGLSTADVFREWSQSSTANKAEFTVSRPSDFLAQAVVGGIRETELVNDLEGPARQLNGEVDETLDRLRRLYGGPVGMSGSGTTCFTLCRTATHARRVASRLQGACNGRVFAAQSRT